MLHKGKCPKCDKQLMDVVFEEISVRQPFGQGEWRGISYQCPMCRAVLSVGIDPVALKTDMVNEVLRAVAKR